MVDIAVGLTGPIGSGKTVFAEFFKKQEFVYFSLSDELRQIAKNLNIEITRENLHNLGNKLRKEKGNNYLAEKVKQKIITGKYKKVIIDSIRNPQEVESLKKLPGFFLIGIDAPATIRFERVKKRNRESESMNWEEFRKLDTEENTTSGDTSKQCILKCLQMADFIIVNDKDLDCFIKKIEKLYRLILQKAGIKE